ncbi:hypothetical protein PVAND_010403 [Polypedilum vanderplanki]|uniref:Carboxylic ester hydrolase n=1 Tax=Polypedilum vanderplanki TaxID=319348 RepID=A0A9J6CGB1_POLVA|nr:hypothetical protein PVAND_010403 [Polypedilum vanderplanki]
MLKFLIIFNFLLIVNCQIINTQYGPILGAQRTSALNRNYFSFQRIPYMKPPIGTLRFRDPVPPSNWTEVLNCTAQGFRFPQIDLTLTPQGGVFEGDLDSMHINVYTNNLNPQSKYPVMVWIHGGGFRTGSGLTDIYGPDYFMERDIVLVTFNYRLYTFGFLSLDDPELGIPGNAGFKDQVLALKWVKENIENFGGDSKNITIFGQSSGGGCAHYHILSPLSKDLFQRSIIMSGSAFNPMYAAIPRRNWAYRLAKMLNYTGTENEREILAFLEEADPQHIFDAVGNILTPHERNVERLINAFGPVIEPYDNGNAFMLQHPEELAQNSWGNDIDIMIGATSFENGMVLPVLLLGGSEVLEAFTNFSTFIPYPLNRSNEEREKLAEMLKRTYFGFVEPSPTNFDGSILLSSEFAFWHVIDRVVKQRVFSRGLGKTYVYRFDADSDNNCFRTLYRVDPRWHRHHRAIHMDDLCYLFKTSFANVPANNTNSFNLIQHMLSIFTTFSSTGNPGITNWKPSTNAQETLFGHNIRETRALDSIEILPEHKRIFVWEEIYRSSALSFNVNFIYIILLFSLAISSFFV